MITHRICCLVLIAVYVGGCGPGVRSVPPNPAWPPAAELSEQPVARERQSVRVRKSSGFAETQAGFVMLPPAEEEAPASTPSSPKVAPEVVSQDRSEAATEPAKAIEDKSRETVTAAVSTKKAPETLPPLTVPSPVVTRIEPEKKTETTKTFADTDSGTSSIVASKPAQEAETVTKVEKEVENPLPVVSPPATPAIVETEKSTTSSTPPVPVAPQSVTAAVEAEKEPTVVAPPVVFVRPPVAVVTDPATGVATPIPVAPPLPAPDTTSPVPAPSVAPITPPPAVVAADPKKGVTTVTPDFVTPPVIPAPADINKDVVIPASPVPPSSPVIAKPAEEETPPPISPPSVPAVSASAGVEKDPVTAAASPPDPIVPAPPPAVEKDPVTAAASPPDPVVPAPPPAAVDAEKTAEPSADKEIAALRPKDLAGAADPTRPPDLVEPEKAIGFTPAHQEMSDQERLATLWTKRKQEQAGAEYPVGPGDVLSINVPGMDEIKEQTVRISTEGTIALPLVGTIQTAGMTANQVREEIRRRLAADYMHNPEVQLFVKEYRSRQVAVVGAVAKPGLYPLSSGTETILEMVSQAGGVTDEAASYLHFVPAQPAKNGNIKEIAATLPESVTNAHPGLLLMEKTDPVLIDLQNQMANNSRSYLLLPVWPGDVIMVPGGGEVLVDGWVAKPGSYKISRGLTVLGVVAAAGGSLFAADTSAVKVIRVKSKGDKAIFVANLEQIRTGKQQDIPVQGGDVIEVTASTAKLLPYGMYKFISTIFRVGASAPLF